MALTFHPHDSIRLNFAMSAHVCTMITFFVFACLLTYITDYYVFGIVQICVQQCINIPYFLTLSNLCVLQIVLS